MALLAVSRCCQVNDRRSLIQSLLAQKRFISIFKTETDTRKKKKKIITKGNRSIFYRVSGCKYEIRIVREKRFFSLQSFQKLFCHRIILPASESGFEQRRLNHVEQKDAINRPTSPWSGEPAVARSIIIGVEKSSFGSPASYDGKGVMCSLPINSGRRSKPLPGVGAAGRKLYRVIEFIPSQSPKSPPRHIFAVFIITVIVMVTDNPVTIPSL